MCSKAAVISLALTTMLGGLACSERSADQAKRNADAAVDAGKVAADKIDFKVQRSGDDQAGTFVAKKAS